MTQPGFKSMGKQSDVSGWATEGSRERFETRIRNSSFSNVAQWVLMRDEAGSYKDRQIQNRWEDWQVCEAALRSEITDLQDKLRKSLNQNSTPLGGAATNQEAAQSLALLRLGLDQMRQSLDGNRITEDSSATALRDPVERD
jgi:hypothetical protein